MKQVVGIRIVFENCEVVEVPNADVRYIHMDGITESLWNNNILREESFDFKIKKQATSLRLIIKDKEEYARVKQWNNIVSIAFKGIAETVEEIYIAWSKEITDYFDMDDCTNPGQSVTVKKDEIDIVIEQVVPEVKENSIEQ